MITYEVIKSYLNCNYKAYLKLQSQVGNITDYIQLQNETNNKIKHEFIQKILSDNHNELNCQDISKDTLKSKFDFIINGTLTVDNFQINIPVLELESDKLNPEIFFYIPITTIPNEKIIRKDKILVAIICLLLSKIQGNQITSAKIVYNEQLNSSKIKINKYLNEAKESIIALSKLFTEHIDNLKFILNTHCHVCEYNNYCRAKAIENDELSLLNGVGIKEIEKWKNKGIFTVNQLSYTFKPKRKRKKPINYQKPHSFELQALAIRENKIYVYETPTLPKTHIEIYFDIEGIPERRFYYLIGLLIRENNQIKEFSFWAENEADAIKIFNDFLNMLDKYNHYTIFHFGSYELNYLKYMKIKLTKSNQKKVDNILSSSCNLLSYFYSNIYLPTYSNRLKEIGNYLGFKWTDEKAAGIQSIVWRKKWEANRDQKLKDKLIQYNREDCYVLIKINELINSIIENENSNIPNVVYQKKLTFTFRLENFALPEMKMINECAYFDYQRERVHIRTNENIKKIQKNKERRKRLKDRVNKTITITSRVCRKCKSKNIIKTGKDASKNVIDLKFFNSGVKKWVIKHNSFKYYCLNCKKTFLPKKYGGKNYYEHNIKCWVIAQHIVNRESFKQIQSNCYDLFDINIPTTSAFSFKEYICYYYKTTYTRLLKKILNSDVIYVDETPFNLRTETTYAWVFTNGEEVISFYKPIRDGDFLKELLKDFKGVLISDFFPAYDSIDCPQQKCLIHLMRDFNADLLKNPFDEEFKSITRQFTKLLQDIVKTIDKYGLKQKNLNKHKKEVAEFFKKVLNENYRSEIAQQYQKRLEKNENKLFTFLDYDNVSWNNTYAEHAIKLFATHRNKNIKFFKSSRIEDYLKIMSLYQTCEYKGISFLKFLISKEKNFDVYCEKYN